MSADLAIAILIGRLTRDAELKYTSSGTAMLKVGMAVSVREKKGVQWVDVPNFYNLVVWGKEAERLNQHMVKGRLVAVEGTQRQDKWTQDGVDRMAVEINCKEITPLGAAPGQDGTRQAPPAQAPREAPPARPAPGRNDYEAKPVPRREPPKDEPPWNPDDLTMF